MTLPLSLRGKYQLVVLGPESNPEVSEYAARLDIALNLAFSHLGVNAQKFLIRVMSGASDPNMDRRMLSVAVFFGLMPSPVLPRHDTERLDHLIGIVNLTGVLCTASTRRGILVP